MTGPILLVGVGVMVVLAGLVGATTTLLGFEPPRGNKLRATRANPRPRITTSQAVAAVAGLLALLLTGWVAVGVGTAGAVILVPSVLGKSDAQHRIARLEGLGSWTRRLADLLASGAASSLDRALTKSAAIAPAAIATEVSTLAYRMGPQGTRAALLAFARDMADPVSDEVVMSLILQLRHGGRGLAAVLTDLAVHVDDQVRMRRDVEADRAKPRSNVRTLVLLTLGLSAGLILFARTYLAPYSSAGGQFALAAVVAVFACALLWLRAMTRQTPGVRLLVEADFGPESTS